MTLKKLQISELAQYFKLVTTLWLTVTVLFACQYKNNTSVREDVLVYCSEGSPETFNPQLSTSGVTFDASSRTIYNRLVEFQPGTTNITPALASSWKISEDGKEYTFKLRKDVEFHTTGYFKPTRNFNADDVLFSFQKQWLKTHPYYKSVQNSTFNYGYFESMGLDDLIVSIIKIDPYTLKFNLNRAESPFLATLAMDFASILSAEYAQHLLNIDQTELLDTQPIGTGPFQLVRYQPDAFIRYIASPNYWKGKAKFNHLVFAITPDPSLRFARIVAGECDVMANPLPAQIASANQFKNISMLSESGLNIAFLSLNNYKTPFNNPKVRIAMNHAINKESIIKAVYRETAKPAVTLIPPNMWAFDETINDYQYDPKTAKELLVEAGYPNGFKMQVWTNSAQRPYNPNAKKMAEQIQQDLAKIGITVEITTFELGSFLNKVRHGEHHSALMGWTGDNGDPDNFFTPLLSCESSTNSAFWCDPSFNQLIFHARSQTRKTTRKHLYSEALKIFKQASPWVPIAHAEQRLIFNSRVKNLKITPSGGINFNGVFLETQNTTLTNQNKQKNKENSIKPSEQEATSNE